MKKIIILFFIVVTSFYITCKVYTIQTNSITTNKKIYLNKELKVSLNYPANWKANSNYKDRYEGDNGFFQVGAITGGDLTIDEVAKLDAFHKLNPYGTKPQIEAITIQGQRGRLVLPSDDQGEEMDNQSSVIVKYPKPVKVGNTVYNYFILWADKDHIVEISKSIIFI
jgi:TolB protein